MVKSDRCGRKEGGTDRRRFLTDGCALCAGAGLMAAPGWARARPALGKLRLRVVYVLSAVVQKSNDWPNLGFDFAPVMEKYNNALTGAFAEIEFLPVIAKGPTRMSAVLAGDLGRDVDGYIVFQLNSWKLSVLPVTATKKPMLFVPLMYAGTGGFLVFNAMFLRQKAGNVGFVSSSDFDDVIEAVKCFESVKSGGASGFGDAVARVRRERTPGPGDLTLAPDPLPAITAEEAISRMKESRILAVGYPGVSSRWIPMIGMKMIPFSELDRAFRKADPDRARELAGRWREDAAVVEGVSEQALADSAAMHLGMESLMKKYGANAVTVNCLVGFYSGGLHAYPCMGFHEMNNNGLVGACECDVRSAGTMLAVNALSGGRPGYISDPVLDTANRRIIYAHCVASNRPFGPDGPANPFEILTHSEDRKGASVRSILPAGYLTTTIEIAPERKEILMHRAKTVGNDPDDRACRTKLVAEPVGDFEKLFTFWDRWGWHRVTVYGDLKDRVHELAEAMGYRVVQEA
ncbi:MAG TPA: hypothetical protein VM658_22280 [bacterium]|nr:hypothetical protein [bacterium]